MPTVVKKFHFKTNAEGWVANPSQSTVHMGWKPPRKSRDQSSVAIDMGGYLTTRYIGNNAASNYYELSTTWQALGVPEWAIVRRLSVNYAYRWNIAGAFGQAIIQDANASGPFELRKSDGTLAGNVVEPIYLPTNAIGASDKKYFNEFRYPYVAGNDPEPKATTDEPLNWGYASGELAIPTDLKRSTTPINLRLVSLVQAVIKMPSENNRNRSYMRLKQDRIVLTIDYTRRDVSVI